MICKEGFEEKVNISHGNIHSDDYYLLKADITNISQVEEKLNESKINTENFTIFIAECLLVYIKKNDTYEMLKSYTNMFKNILFLEYDLIGAFDPFGKEMIVNLSERGISLSGYEELPDEESHKNRYLETGFKFSEVVDCLQYYHHGISKEEKKVIEHLEMMDEFEEFNLLMKHSCFGYGISTNNDYASIYDVVKIKNN